MWKFSLVSRIAIYFSIVSTVIILVTGLSVSAAIYFKIERDVEKLLSTQANTLISDHIVYQDGTILYRLGPQGETFTSRLRDFDLSALIVATDSSPVATYGIYRNILDAGNISSYNGSELLTRASTGNMATYSDESLVPQHLYDTYTTPLRSGNAVVGVMQVAKEAKVIDMLVDTMRNVLFTILPLTILISWILGYIITRVSFEPLVRFIAYIQTIDASHIPQNIRPPVNQAEEITALVHTFNAMLERIRDGIAKHTSYVAHASHEIKTPLARAVTTLHLAGTRISADQNPEEIQAIKHVENELLELGSTVDSLLELSGISRREDVMDTEEIDLLPVIQKRIDRWKNTLQEKNISVKMSLTPERMIRMNKNHFILLIDNLLGNAVKYNTSDGILLVYLDNKSKDTGLCIENSGIVMTPEEKAHAFDRRYRGDSGKLHTEGQGLGLALVREIARIYGLKINLINRKPSGMIVRISQGPFAALSM